MNALMTHALFGETTRQRMRAAGIGFVDSSDSVVHASNVVELDALLAAAIRALPAG